MPFGSLKRVSQQSPIHPGYYVCSGDKHLVLGESDYRGLVALCRRDESVLVGAGIFLICSNQVVRLAVEPLPKQLIVGETSVSRDVMKQYPTILFIEGGFAGDRFREVAQRLHDEHLARTARLTPDSAGVTRDGYIIT
jgi:hypothetical protein